MTPEQSSKLIQVLENISNTLADIHTDMISNKHFEEKRKQVLQLLWNSWWKI